VGIATGNGLLVIDIDPRHGGSLAALAGLVDLEHVSTVETGSGGWHLYFRYDAGVTLRNTAGKLGDGIDTRARGGYVVAPPSIHASGHHYRWLNDCAFTLVPEPLLRRLTAPGQEPCTEARPASAGPPAPPMPDTPPAPIAQPAHAEVAQGSTPIIPEGKRNTSLMSLAGTLRHWGADDRVLFPMLQVMNKTCCQPALSEEEVRQIARNATSWQPGVPNAPRSGLDGEVPGRAILTEEVPDMAWAIPGCLPEGVTLLGGKPKKGKTYLALGMALGIASGLPVLGYPPPRQGRALFIGLEEPRRGMRDRLRTMLAGRPCPDLLSWCGYWRPILEGGLEDLEVGVGRHEDARLIVIDTLERVRSDNISGSIYSYDYKTITPLKQFAERHHLSVLVVHHLRKGTSDDPMEDFSGSLGLTGSTDCNMVLYRLHKSDEGTLHITGNYVESQEVSLHFDTERTTREKTDAPVEEPKTPSPERQTILDLLRQQGCPMTPVEIARRLGKEKSSIRSILYSMKRDEQVVVVGQGMYMLAGQAQQQALLEEEAK
jgi:hypothetical protein